MKKTRIIFTAFLAALTASRHGQGQLILENVNTSPSPSATSNGLFWLAADKVKADKRHEQFIVLIEQLAV